MTGREEGGSVATGASATGALIGRIVLCSVVRVAAVW